MCPESGVPSMRPGPDRRFSVDPVLSTDGYRTTVRVVGDLDLLTADLLLSELTSLARAGYVDVDLDLSGVPFCDGSGFSALVQGREQLMDRGGTLVLQHPCWALRRILDVFDLTVALEAREPGSATLRHPSP